MYNGGRRATHGRRAVAQSVKDVLQSLVDDGLVDTERIGTSNYYWAFPSKGLQIRKRKIEEIDGQQEQLRAKRKALEVSVRQASVGREDDVRRAVRWARSCPPLLTGARLDTHTHTHTRTHSVWCQRERAGVAARLQTLRSTSESLKSELQKYRESDPEVLQAKRTFTISAAGCCRCCAGEAITSRSRAHSDGALAYRQDRALGDRGGKPLDGQHSSGQVLVQQ